MKILRIALLCALMLAPVESAMAQDDDIASKIINKPGSTNVRGGKAKNRNDSAVQGGKAIRLPVTKAANAWDVTLNADIDKPIKAGDNLILAFWARAEKGDDGGMTAKISHAAIQVNSPPWTSVIQGQAAVGPNWELHQVKGKADKDYPAGGVGVTIHLGDAGRTIDFGPLFVLNMGQ
jgi:hypothetical protein